MELPVTITFFHAAHLLSDVRGEAALTRLWQALNSDDRSFEEVAIACKQRVLDELFGSEVGWLAATFQRVLRQSHHRDDTLQQVSQVIREVACHLPVYRTYIRPGRPVSPPDRERVFAVATAAKQARADLDPSLFDLFADILLRGKGTSPCVFSS